jgi:hypothetical protein
MYAREKGLQNSTRKNNNNNNCVLDMGVNGGLNVKRFYVNKIKN